MTSETKKKWHVKCDAVTHMKMEPHKRVDDNPGLRTYTKKVTPVFIINQKKIEELKGKLRYCMLKVGKLDRFGLVISWLYCRK
jgi:hypothetical protein